MTRVAVVVLCLLIVMTTAHGIDVTTSSLSDSYDAFFDARAELIKNEKYPGLFYALCIWSGVNSNTLSQPKLRIVDESLGFNTSIEYHFENGRDSFVYKVTRPPNTFRRYSFSMTFESAEIRSSHFWRFVQVMTPPGMIPDVAFDDLLQSGNLEQDGVGNYFCSGTYYRIGYTVELSPNEGKYIHTVFSDT